MTFDPPKKLYAVTNGTRLDGARCFKTPAAAQQMAKRYHARGEASQIIPLTDVIYEQRWYVVYILTAESFVVFKRQSVADRESLAALKAGRDCVICVYSRELI